MTASRRRICFATAVTLALALILSCSTGVRKHEWLDPHESRMPAAVSQTAIPETVIPLQIERMKNHISAFDQDNNTFKSNGGRVQINDNPAIAGFWQMPPLPNDYLILQNGQELAMRMGAIQASVLPSGKVLMVSGSSNRGDKRPCLNQAQITAANNAKQPPPACQKNPAVTSQAYNFIDNTELFNPALIPGPPDDPRTPVNAAQLEFPAVPAGELENLAFPLGMQKQEFLYERPASLPESALAALPQSGPDTGSAPFSSNAGTLADPAFCRQERPAGTPLFNNGMLIVGGNAAQFCTSIADPALKGGVGIQALPLEEEAHSLQSPNPGDPDIDLFCGGHHPLPDGNVLFAGGTRKAVSFQNGSTIPFYGIKRTLVFDWKLQQWKEASATGAKVDMGDGRWYPTLVELPDGKVFIIGGMNHRGEISHTLEVYDPKSQTMSELFDFHQVGPGAARVPFDPFTVLDPTSHRRFDNFPRVFLTQLLDKSCTDPIHCSILLITGDGSAEGDRDLNQNHTLYVFLDTRGFTDANHREIRVRFQPGPDRNIAGPGQTHLYTTHLYPTTIFDPTSEQGEYMILGGSIGIYDPLHVAEEEKTDNNNQVVIDPTTKRPALDPDKSTAFNSKNGDLKTKLVPPHRTVTDMERIHMANGTLAFEPVVEHFLGDDCDPNAKVGTSHINPAARRTGNNCVPGGARPDGGPINGSGMINSNAVLLPTRQFLVMGGGNHSYEDPVFNPVLFTPAGDPLIRPPLSGPVVGKTVGREGEQWFRNLMNPVHLPRLYHNTALLLPDGRVFMGGGNTFISSLMDIDGRGLPLVGQLGGQSNNYNNFLGADTMSGGTYSVNGQAFANFSADLPAEQYQVELFDPPYLFIPGLRPVIHSISINGGPQRALPPGSRWINENQEDVIGYNQVLSLVVDNVANGELGTVTLIRIGGVTHAFNFSQKLHTLHEVVLGTQMENGRQVTTASVDRTTKGWVTVARSTEPGVKAMVNVATQPDPISAPPGYYMLFYVNKDGKPSEARMLRLCSAGGIKDGQFTCAD
jgi:hypothetical protein